MVWRTVHFVKTAVLLATAFLLAIPPALAQADGRGYRSEPYPWNRPGYRGYNEPPIAQPPSGPAASPQRYTVQVTVLLQKNQDDSNTALVVAHLPEEAQIWFEDEPTQQRGNLRQFVSPPLVPGKKYTCTVRVQWPEDGRWVSQVHTFPVHAGDIHCIDVVASDSPAVQKEVASNLARLDPEDRKLAERQRFCAAQEGIHLGAMGVPVKITVKGQQVFLCCKGCAEKALAEPDKTLLKAKDLRARQAAPPEK
jgi:uncharacterized protein (TIGR03000 family)